MRWPTPAGLLRSVGISRGSKVHRQLRGTYNFVLPRLRAKRYWSQTGEDVVVAQYLPERTGHFVDVGAGRPTVENNTWHLYKRGWTGVLVDPLPMNCREARWTRRRDRIIQSACGRQEGTAEIFVMEPWQYTTVSRDQVAKACQHGAKLKKRYKTRIIPLNSLNLRSTPMSPSLMSVDVEGFELEVLLGNDWSQFRPRVILVEDHSIAESDIRNTNSPTDELLRSEGYKLRAFTGLTSVYVHSSYRG